MPLSWALCWTRCWGSHTRWGHGRVGVAGLQRDGLYLLRAVWLLCREAFALWNSCATLPSLGLVSCSLQKASQGYRRHWPTPTVLAACRPQVLTVQSGDDMPSMAREIAHHFDTQGAPALGYFAAAVGQWEQRRSCIQIMQRAVLLSPHTLTTPCRPRCAARAVQAPPS